MQHLARFLIDCYDFHAFKYFLQKNYCIYCIVSCNNTRRGTDREKIDDSINFCKFVLASSVPLLIVLGEAVKNGSRWLFGRHVRHTVLEYCTVRVRV